MFISQHTYIVSIQCIVCVYSMYVCIYIYTGKTYIVYIFGHLPQDVIILIFFNCFPFCPYLLACLFKYIYNCIFEKIHLWLHCLLSNKCNLSTFTGIANIFGFISAISFVLSIYILLLTLSFLLYLFISWLLLNYLNSHDSLLFLLFFVILMDITLFFCSQYLDLIISLLTVSSCTWVHFLLAKNHPLKVISLRAYL